MDNCITLRTALTVLYKTNSLDYTWRVFGHKATGEYGLPAPGRVINGICVADQVWTKKVNILPIAGRVWHQVEPFSVQA